MKIRKATLKDIPDLMELYKGAVNYHSNIATKEDKFYDKRSKDADKEWKKFLKKSIKGRNSLVLIVYDNKKPIAYCISLIRKNIPVHSIKKFGFISDLYVNEKYRGKGVGKELLNKSKEFLKKKKKMKFMHLAVMHNNIPSIKFYEKYGFKEYMKNMRMRI